MATKTASAPAGLKQLDTLLEEYLVKKVPALPLNIKELIVSFAPWLVILGIIFSALALLGILGFTTMVSTVPYGQTMVRGFSLAILIPVLFLIANMILNIMALPGLRAKSLKGWTYAWYAVLVNAVYMLLSWEILSFLVGTAISLYVLYQVKAFYK